MELEILKLIYDYSAKRKLVDLKFINKLIGIVVSKKNLNDYVSNVRFTNELNKNDSTVVCAAYNPLSKDILVDYESISMLLENKSNYDCLFHTFEQIMFRNLVITQIILHELEHANQHKKVDSMLDDSIETKLIGASFILEQAMKNPKFRAEILTGQIPIQDLQIYVLENRNLYKKYYALNPTERFAQVNSFKTIVNSIEPIKNDVSNLFEFENASLIEEMLKGYQKSWEEGICPTQVYLFGTRQDKVWTKLNFYDEDTNKLIEKSSKQYNLAERLSLGLPITYKEYETTNDWLQATNKYSI